MFDFVHGHFDEKIYKVVVVEGLLGRGELCIMYW